MHLLPRSMFARMVLVLLKKFFTLIWKIKSASDYPKGNIL